MPIPITPHSEADALKASAMHRRVLKPGWHNGTFREVVQQESEAGNNMLVACIVVTDPEGNEHELRDYILIDLPAGALKLRHAVQAIGALAKYERGEIDEADFASKEVAVKIGIETRRGPYAGRAVILDYRAPSASHVVNLRQASGGV